MKLRPRLTIAGMMAAVAGTGIGLGLYEQGRRAGAPAPIPSVYITRRGDRYHTASCRYAARATAVRIDQVGDRYQPCAYCRPPALPGP